MTFLKKLGSMILQGLQIVARFEGPVTSTVPGAANVIQIVSKDLTQIAQIIADVEVAGQVLGLPGTQKLTAAAPLVAQVVLDSTVLAGKHVANEALFRTGAQKIADGMADIENSLKADDLVVTSKV